MSNMDLIIAEVLQSIMQDKPQSPNEAYVLLKVTQAIASKGMMFSPQEIMGMVASISEAYNTLFPSNRLSSNPGLVKEKGEVNKGVGMTKRSRFLAHLLVKYSGQDRAEKVDSLIDYMEGLPDIFPLEEMEHVLFYQASIPGSFTRLLYYCGIGMSVVRHKVQKVSSIEEELQALKNSEDPNYVEPESTPEDKWELINDNLVVGYDFHAPEGYGEEEILDNKLPENIEGNTEIPSVEGWVFYHFLEFFEKLSLEQTLGFLGKVFPKATINDQSIKFPYGNSEFVVFNFVTGMIKARVERHIRETVTINNRQHHGRHVMALMVLSYFTQSSIEGINNYLNDLPNLWQRDPAYGVQALNEFKSRKTPAQLKFSKTELPVKIKRGFQPCWFRFTSDKFDPDYIETVVARGLPVVTDRYALKEVGEGSVAEAAGIGRNHGIPVIDDETEEVIHCDVMMFWNDVSKLSKMLNRPAQSYHFLCAQLNDWQEAKFGIKASDGVIYRQGGRQTKFLYCLTTLGGGSGPAYTRPGYTINYSVRKSSDSGRVDFLSLPLKVRQILTEKGSQSNAKSPGISALENLVEDACKARIGSKFKYGEEMLGIDVDLGNEEVYHKTILVNRSINQEFEVVDYTITHSSQTVDGEILGEWFTVKFTVNLVVEDPLAKGRLAFFKMVFRPGDNINILDEEGNDIGWEDHEVMVTSETVKANNFKYVFFVEAMGGGYLEASTGRLYLDNIDNAKEWLSEEEKANGYIDLLPEVRGRFVDSEEDGSRRLMEIVKHNPKDNAVTRWLKDNVQTRQVQAKMSKRYFEYWSRINSEYLNSESVKVEEKDDYFLITETCECISGTSYYEVEISTPREAGSKTGLTVQELSAYSVLDYKLAEGIYNESREHQQSIVKIVQMANGSLKCPVFPMTNREMVKQFAGLVDKVCQKQGLGNGLCDKTDAQVLDIMATIFKNGVSLGATNTVGEETLLALDFRALRSTNVFVNGFCDEGPLKGVLTLLKFVYESANQEDDPFSLIYSRLRFTKTAMSTWLMEQISSKALLKRASQSTKVRVTGKITTGFDPYLDDEDGLPVLYLHPDDDRLRMLFTDSNGNLQEEYFLEVNGKKELNIRKIMADKVVVGSGRTPMVMTGFFLLKIDAEKGFIGYTNMSADCWTHINHGDGDGDGDALLNGSRYGIDAEKAKVINQMLLSMGGYFKLFGSNPADHPYADFCSVGEAKLKKSFLASKNLVYCWMFTPRQYVEITRNVGSHYRGPVGITYGIASVLIFDLANKAFTLSDKERSGQDFKFVEYAALMSWGVLYEGLGLSGWSESASEFFKYLRFHWADELGFDARGSLTPDKSLWVDGKSVNPKDEMVKILMSQTNLSAFDAKPELRAPFVKAILAQIIEAENIRQGFGALANGRKQAKRIREDANLYLKTAIAGCLREGSRGTDVGGLAQYEDDLMEEISIESVHSSVVEHKMWNAISNPWLSEMLENIAKLHDEASLLKYEQEQAESYGF